MSLFAGGHIASVLVSDPVASKSLRVSGILHLKMACGERRNVMK